ncbi:hypothetical protein Tco_0240865 [Tanacetum coccineum]
MVMHLPIASASTEGPIPPKTAEQKLARKNELKAKSTLLLAIPDEHLLKFQGIKDAKTLWEAIKTWRGHFARECREAPHNQGIEMDDVPIRIVIVNSCKCLDCSKDGDEVHPVHHVQTLRYPLAPKLA